MKLNITKTLLLGLGFLGVNAIWAIYSVFVPDLLDHKHHQSLAWITFFMTLDNSTAFVIQPLVGVWSDKIRTPIGRRMPFILVGAPLAALAFALIPRAPVLPLFVMSTSTLLLAMAAWRTPVMALMADVTAPALRSQASGIIAFMGGVGSILAYYGGAWLAPKNPAYPFYLGSAIVLIAAVLLLLFVREPREAIAETETIDAGAPGFFASLRELFADKDRNALFLLCALTILMVGYSAVEGFFELYATHHLGWSAARASRVLGQISLVFVVFAIPAGNLGGQFGRRRTIMTGLLIMTALLGTVYFLPVATLLKPLASAGIAQQWTLIDAILMGVGLAWALVIIHPLPMLSNMVDNSRVGTYTGLYYAFTSLAAIIGPYLNGFIVRQSGGNYNTVMLFSPIAFALAWAMMWGVREPKIAASAVEII